jgi:hypothetical protein
MRAFSSAPRIHNRMHRFTAKSHKNGNSLLKGELQMGNKGIINYMIAVALASAVLLLAPVGAQAHCDSLDGPVVTAAREALESGNVNLVLIWVQKADEAEITFAFQKALSVRKLNPQAKELADTYFFETLVRVHRAGEGEPYTGLKPAGRDLGPAIPAGDKAIERRSIEALLNLVIEKAQEGLHSRFHQVVEKSAYSKDNVEPGREYVKAYVEYIHYVEKLYEAASAPAGEHAHQSDSAIAHGDQHK